MVIVGRGHRRSSSPTSLSKRVEEHSSVLLQCPGVCRILEMEKKPHQNQSLPSAVFFPDFVVLSICLSCSMQEAVLWQERLSATGTDENISQQLRRQLSNTACVRQQNLIWAEGQRWYCFPCILGWWHPMGGLHLALGEWPPEGRPKSVVQTLHLIRNQWN